MALRLMAAAAEDTAIELGAGRFIPGFEEQLVGVKVGDEKTITVTFPEDYPAENLKGKEATFDITVKAVKVAGETKATMISPRTLGLESVSSSCAACCAASLSRKPLA
jgi:trigger factor